MASDPRVATRITEQANIRLRTLALLQRESPSRVLDRLLDQALPSLDELAAKMQAGDSSPVAA